MLKQMLRLVAEGEVTTYEALAHALGVSQELVSQMMVQLTAQGYLGAARGYSTAGERCGVGCAGCGFSSSCGTQEGLRIWTLTEKGRRAVARWQEAPGT